MNRCPKNRKCMRSLGQFFGNLHYFLIRNGLNNAGESGITLIKKDIHLGKICIVFIVSSLYT